MNISITSPVSNSIVCYEVDIAVDRKTLPSNAAYVEYVLNGRSLSGPIAISA